MLLALEDCISDFQQFRRLLEVCRIMPRDACQCTKGWTMTLARLPGGISRSPERLIMAYYAIDVQVVPVLLFEVRPAKHEYEGDVYDEGGGCGRERVGHVTQRH